ncbi:hypothetical protein TRIATDRAFT_303047 [Trichoderma atroviride IMI 206040]|uniref:Uncharacterized protein n=1 Tax=Hypocrea atroviridis (strain ATCC 20476 / IMI 206040) TaxID=452589 RepID=G9PBK6_HYPAI|nr:uncharacterized protein TRIATDRAFT_303047 [Trichoderma atroviride IMI 206040]EHK39749.1 hypothetical protein TRIATDRAFT_303047 [Trichoderma atroviride IMI 206040]
MTLPVMFFLSTTTTTVPTTKLYDAVIPFQFVEYLPVCYFTTLAKLVITRLCFSGQDPYPLSWHGDRIICTRIS